MTRSLLPRISTEPVNVLLQHGDQLRAALECAALDRPDDGAFRPTFELPETTAELVEYFSVADLRFADLGTAGGTDLVLLDLMANPGTRTVKTLASHVIVARAVRHIAATGEPIMILTPSSANKATALRDAVLRAIRIGLVREDQLQIVCIVPDAARAKLWNSELDHDRNPICVLDPSSPDHVKTLAQRAVYDVGDDLHRRTGIRLWHTMDLANYRCADAVRAAVEQAVLPPRPGVSRIHAHAVSSAFGLLGHHFGTTMLPEVPKPGYFLVQHLATPDMVCSLHGLTPPPYEYDRTSGLFRQDHEPRYPATTFDPDECLESTFYTHQPATSAAMNKIIGAQGGGGIVVSLHECLERYGEVRGRLTDAGHTLPADPRDLREWSLVMAMTGVLNGIERGLLNADEVVVHGSGSYAAGDYEQVPPERLRPVQESADLYRAIADAADATDAG